MVFLGYGIQYFKSKTEFKKKILSQVGNVCNWKKEKNPLSRHKCNKIHIKSKTMFFLFIKFSLVLEHVYFKS